MAEDHGNPHQDTVDAIFGLLPAAPEEAVGVSTATCAAACIDAGLDDEQAVRGLRAALASLRRRMTGRRH